ASPVRSHLGPLARTVEDLIVAWRVLTGDPVPLTPIDQGVRVRRVAGDPDHRGVVDEALDRLHLLRACTGEASPVDLPPLPEATTRDGDWVFAGDHLAAAEQLRPSFWERHREDLTGYARPIYDAGRRVPAWE